MPVVSWVYSSETSVVVWLFSRRCQHEGDTLMFLGLLLDITDLLCHALKRILVVGVLELELCVAENTC